jgi:uncharacterized caspase-like protein
MSQLLSAMGFKVISGTNLTKHQFETKIVEFSAAAKTADLSLFFYAGHGLQVAGKNYLFPVDAKVESDNALNFELINVEAVTNHMGGEKKTGIVLLDACRKNPFLNSLAQGLGEARAMSISDGVAAIFGKTRAALVSPGLAAMSSEGRGLVFGYATAPGDVAADGGSGNSPFTTALLKRLPMKGIELREVLKQMKADVIEATHNAQQPWTNADLSTDVYLQPSK